MWGGGGRYCLLGPLCLRPCSVYIHFLKLRKLLWKKMKNVKHFVCRLLNYSSFPHSFQKCRKRMNVTSMVFEKNHIAGMRTNFPSPTYLRSQQPSLGYILFIWRHSYGVFMQKGMIQAHFFTSKSRKDQIQTSVFMRTPNGRRGEVE